MLLKQLSFKAQNRKSSTVQTYAGLILVCLRENFLNFLRGSTLCLASNLGFQNINLIRFKFLNSLIKYNLMETLK